MVKLCTKRDNKKKEKEQDEKKASLRRRRRRRIVVNNYYRQLDAHIFLQISPYTCERILWLCT